MLSQGIMTLKANTQMRADYISHDYDQPSDGVNQLGSERSRRDL